MRVWLVVLGYFRIISMPWYAHLSTLIWFIDKRDRQMKSFSQHPPARDGQTLIFVQLSHLISDLDCDFTIEAHLGANSQDFYC